jgi:hypothetical protein
MKILKVHEEMTGKKPQVTYIHVPELETRMFPNPKDFAAQVRAQLHVSFMRPREHSGKLTTTYILIGIRPMWLTTSY